MLALFLASAKLSYIESTNPTEQNMFFIITSEDSKLGPFDEVVLATSDYEAACKELRRVRKICKARMVCQA